MVRDKHPNNQSKKAPVVEITLLIWKILYNAGQRVAEILRQYPEMLNKKSLASVPPIGAAVYMNDFQSAEILLQKGANLNIVYAFSRKRDGYHAISMTAITRAMILHGVQPDMAKLLLKGASTDAKLHALTDVLVTRTVPGLRDRVLALAASLDEKAEFLHRVVRFLIESVLQNNTFDDVVVDGFGSKFYGFCVTGRFS